MKAECPIPELPARALGLLHTTERLWQDPKSTLQEKAQEHEGVTPSYGVLREEGPDHDKHFVVGVHLRNDLLAEGEGKSKQEAEQAAAKKRLHQLGCDLIDLSTDGDYVAPLVGFFRARAARLRAGR